MVVGIERTVTACEIAKTHRYCYLLRASAEINRYLPPRERGEWCDFVNFKRVREGAYLPYVTERNCSRKFTKARRYRYLVRASAEISADFSFSRSPAKARRYRYLVRASAEINRY